MIWKFAPRPVIAASVLVSFAGALLIIALSTAQPWLGLRFSAETGEVTLTGIAGASDVPLDWQGRVIDGIVRADGTFIPLSPLDLVEEPDTISDPEQTRAFFTQQDVLHAALVSGAEVTLVSGSSTVAVTPRPARPLAELPVKVWIQVFVGLVGLIIGGWVVALRSDELSAWMVLVTGLGLALSAWAAALYSGRELALATTVFWPASRINSTGSLMFGVGMLTLFLIYPRRILPRPMIALPALVLGGFITFLQLADWPEYLPLMPASIAATMIVLLVAIAAQVVVNRKDPTARAMLGWFGLCVAAGAGGFVLTVVVPTLLGIPLVLEQGTAFLLFLIIYIGIALGVARYRLFDLSIWSFRALFYGTAVALLLALDAALIYGLSLDRAPAFGVALAMIGALYLPLRGRIDERLRRSRTLPEEDLFRRVNMIAHAIEPDEKQSLLIQFWVDLFDPLSLAPLPPNTASDTHLNEAATTLTVAPVLGLPALELTYANQGGRLFSSADLTRAQSLHTLIDSSLRQNQTYLEAVTLERSRINRDMHDNIGVLLLSALHATDLESKDLMIRQTLTDLREIISNPDMAGRPLLLLVADMRAEILDHLDAAEIKVDWRAEGLPDVPVGPQIVQTLRALLREGVSNIVRHSGAGHVTIKLAVAQQDLVVSLADDGSGYDAQQATPGNGIRNLTERVKQAGGTFALTRQTKGTVLQARLPLRNDTENSP